MSGSVTQRQTVPHVFEKRYTSKTLSAPIQKGISLNVLRLITEVEEAVKPIDNG
jgi:hypothetical protein